MFKRRYLKIENLYFIQLHIRINQNFVPFVGVLAKITISLKTGRKRFVSLSVLFQAYLPTQMYESIDFSAVNIISSSTLFDKEPKLGSPSSIEIDSLTKH